MASNTVDNSKETAFLTSLLGRTLRIHTTDKRMFVGTFKCTDMNCNVILSTTFEYRFPSQAAIQAAAETASTQSSDKFKLDMTSRLIGLVVVPGQHITKIEVEQSAQEVRVEPVQVV
ncbi:hypothetical protein BGW36DRAFT_209924 [Talaromyces proteolyticus]|uniref:Sm domain-containing protein n=1 Tax=Talaromyces proteolyticus TaxID=1131652 RepID=A0AAD4PXV2_9EURO|nr:uncharacterized protein BGW36DRAFT_209924 [Talaromyces proteolyticus]KAH8693744.1 hypothetical protein BGW36DRAFT_209924 [Talaromyces proteolyticus]